jgi:hypothetical protein
MANIAFTAAKISSLTGAIKRRYEAGGAITVGHAVYVAADGDVEEADGSAAGTAGAIGVAVASRDGETSIAAGDPVTVVVLGPVGGYTDGTPGAKAWVSDDVGRIADAAGTSGHELGYWESANVLFVLPDPAGAGS